VLADIVNGHDVLVVEGAQGAGFLLKASAAGVAGDFPRQDLDGHQAVETSIAGTENLAHAAGTERVEDFVTAHGFPHHFLKL
jgi:hypothetical protein